MIDGNFRMRCVDSYSNGFLINKEYDVIDGHIHHENGISAGVYNSVDKINNEFCSQFELVEKEKENMRKWNGKIRCVSTEGYTCFTKGKVYEINDGSITTDNGHIDYKYKSLSDFRNRVRAKFEEVFEDDLRELIKPCMVVVTRNGDKHITMQTVDGIILVDKDGRFLDVKSLDVDLKARYRVFERNDVMKVYGLKKFTTEMLNIDEEHRDLLWKREEKSPQQIKIEEIERKQRELADELAELRKDM